MIDFEQDLRERLAERASMLEVPTVAHGHRRGRPVPHRRRVLLALAAASIAVVAGVAALAVGGDTRSAEPEAVTSEATSTTTAGRIDGSTSTIERGPSTPGRVDDTPATLRVATLVRPLLPDFEVVAAYEYDFGADGSSIFVELDGGEGVVATFAIYNVANPAHADLLAESSGELRDDGFALIVAGLTPDGREVALMLHSSESAATLRTDGLREAIDVGSLEAAFAELLAVI